MYVSALYKKSIWCINSHKGGLQGLSMKMAMSERGSLCVKLSRGDILQHWKSSLCSFLWGWAIMVFWDISSLYSDKQLSCHLKRSTKSQGSKYTTKEAPLSELTTSPLPALLPTDHHFTQCQAHSVCCPVSKLEELWHFRQVNRGQCKKKEMHF